MRRHHDPVPMEPVWDRVGIEVLDAPAGILEVERVPCVTNGIATMNGGVLAERRVPALAIERAAEVMHPVTSPPISRSSTSRR